MSDDRDTDDTDVLLNSDPTGGLDMFLGLSLRELSEKHSNLLPPVKDDNYCGNKVDSPILSPQNSSSSISIRNEDIVLNNLELDTTSASDFFNSRGEIVLSGLSEWTDSDIECESRSANEDANSDAGSVASFTYETTAQAHPQPDALVELQQDAGVCYSGDQETRSEILDSSPKKNVEGNSTSTEVALKESHEDSPDRCRGSFIPQFLSHGRVYDINLENPAAGWNIPLPNFLQGGNCGGGDTGHIFTRAPNFRSPGGYKPPPNPQPSRELTEEQVRQEVKSMYAFPDEVGNSEDNTDENSNPTTTTKNSQTTSKVLRFADEVTRVENTEGSDRVLELKSSGDSKKMEFDFLNGAQTPPKFEAEKSPGHDGKPVKRKHFNHKQKRRSSGGKSSGAGDCRTVTSPDSSVSVSTTSEANGDDGVNPETPTNLSNPNSESGSPLALSNLRTDKVPYCTKVIRGKRGTKKSSSGTTGTSGGFSFGYGESESELSPIRGTGGGTVFRTPTTDRDYYADASASDGYNPSVAIDELKSIWREIQLSRHSIRAQEFLSERSAFIEDLGNVPPDSIDAQDPDTNHQGNKSPARAKRVSPGRLSASGDNIGPSVNLKQTVVPMLEDFASDLKIILHDADINPDDFNDIVDDLDTEGCEVGAGIDDLLNEIVDDTPEGVEQAQLSEWARSGANEYLEKYHEEKFRRQELELEIAKLHGEVLGIKQRNAVLEGNMKRKDGALQKLAKSWKTVSEEWKAYELTTKTEFEHLRKDQRELATSCSQSKLRIEEYEKELTKTVELADSFKTKLAELQESKNLAVAQLEKEVSTLNSGVESMKQTVMNVSEDKNVAVRALKESQTLLDAHKTSLEKVASELLASHAKNSVDVERLNEALEQRQKLEARLQNSSVQNGMLESKVKELSVEVASVNLEKEKLLQELEKLAVEKVKEEGDRLHDYYNNKLQEALKSATEKAAKAEATLVESMRQTRLESDRKLSECRERYQADLLRMKTILEVEIQSLKKDNLQKHLLIKTTAQQLQSGEFTRTGELDRLQSIVSTFPSLNSLNERTRDKGRADSLIRSLREDKDTQYSKFVQRLTTKGTTSENLQSTTSDVNKVFPAKFSAEDQVTKLSGQKKSPLSTATLDSIINSSQNGVDK